MVFNLRGGFVSPLPQAASPHAEVDLLSDLEGFPFCAAGEPSFLSSLSPAKGEAMFNLPGAWAPG